MTDDIPLFNQDTLENTLEKLGKNKKRRKGKRKKDVNKLVENCRRLVGDSKNFLEDYLMCMKFGGKIPKKKKKKQNKRTRKKEEIKREKELLLNLDTEELYINER